MSPQPSPSSKKPTSGPDIYTGLLFVSVAALIAGVVFLVLELDKYNWTLAS